MRYPGADPEGVVEGEGGTRTGRGGAVFEIRGGAGGLHPPP